MSFALNRPDIPKIIFKLDIHHGFKKEMLMLSGPCNMSWAVSSVNVLVYVDR